LGAENGAFDSESCRFDRADRERQMGAPEAHFYTINPHSYKNYSTTFNSSKSNPKVQASKNNPLNRFTKNNTKIHSNSKNIIPGKVHKKMRLTPAML
jgi:hypothetical protein